MNVDTGEIKELDPETLELLKNNQEAKFKTFFDKKDALFANRVLPITEEEKLKLEVEDLKDRLSKLEKLIGSQELKRRCEEVGIKIVKKIPEDPK